MSMSNSEIPTPPSTKQPTTLSELFSDEFKDSRKEFMEWVAKKATEDQLEIIRKSKEETN